MTKPSKSPDRHLLQKEKYVHRQISLGKPISEEYLNMFDNIMDDEKHKWDDPTSHENNLEYELVTTDWILAKVRKSDSYAQNLYAAMCNTEFQKLEVMPILKEDRWSCTWRYAGGIVADMQGKGDYIDWYCSGIGFHDSGSDAPKGYVPEGMVTDEIRQDLLKLGWKVIDDEHLDR